MGWKSSTIIVNSDNKINQLELLKDLGFENLTEIDNEPFEVAISPGDSKIYIGKYKDNLLICTQDLPLTFLEEEVSKGEKVLSQYFPNSEISSIVLQSAVNFWGYSVSKNNQKIRVRAGSSDNGTMLEYGEPLEQELNLLSKSKIDENGRRIYHFDDFTNEQFKEDQVGENFVFKFSSRYLGQNLDMADELLFDTELKGYKFNSSFANKKEKVNQTDKPNKWLKYGLIIAVIIVWQILKRTIFNN